MSIISTYSSLNGRLSRGGMLLYGVFVPVLFFLVITAIEFRQFNLFSSLLIALEWVLLSPSLEPLISLKVKLRPGEAIHFVWHDIAKFLLFWPSIALSVKRFHDIGWSARVYFILAAIMAVGFILQLIIFLSLLFGQFLKFDTIEIILLGSLPFIFIPSIIMLVIHLIIPGQPFENRYGADPRDSYNDLYPRTHNLIGLQMADFFGIDEASEKYRTKATEAHIALCS